MRLTTIIRAQIAAFTALLVVALCVAPAIAGAVFPIVDAEMRTLR